MNLWKKFSPTQKFIVLTLASPIFVILPAQTFTSLIFNKEEKNFIEKVKKNQGKEKIIKN